MVRITANGRVDALNINGVLMAPMVVIRQESTDGKNHYAGFVPGIIMKNVVAGTERECMENLKETFSHIVKDMYKKKVPFPFFPTKEEIYKDYQDVKSIAYIKIRKKK